MKIFKLLCTKKPKKEKEARLSHIENPLLFDI